MEKLLTPEEAADKLAVSVKTLKDWLRAGKLKGVKVGRLWRVRESDLEQFIQFVYSSLHSTPRRRPGRRRK